MTPGQRQNLHVKWVFTSITRVTQSVVFLSYVLCTDSLNELYLSLYLLARLLWSRHQGHLFRGCPLCSATSLPADLLFISETGAWCQFHRYHEQRLHVCHVQDGACVPEVSPDLSKNLSCIFTALCLMQLTTILIFRAVVSPSKALIPAIHPLLYAALQDILHTVKRVFPHAEQGLQKRKEQGSVYLETERADLDELIHSRLDIRVTCCIVCLFISRFGVWCACGWADFQWGWGRYLYWTDLSFQTQNTFC